MKGDFTRFTFDPRKHYTRVLKQQGRVDVDADWNEAEEIQTHLGRTQAVDVIGRCGVPAGSNGFRIERGAGGAVLTVAPGRMYVDGILCQLEGAGPVPLTAQPDLPGYLAGEPPLEDGTYLVYADVWERHVTYVEDPDIREVALGGPDTATRTRTLAQVRVQRLGPVAPLEGQECRPFQPLPADGTLAAREDPGEDPANVCVVPAGGGYRGLENRLYRVEIHDDGRDATGAVVRTPTFKWSRDNGSVVLPVVDGGIDGDTVTLRRLGHDDVLTVHVDDWVEVLGDATELHGRHGTLAQVAADGIDRADLELTLTADASAHAAEGHLKVRRWDHHETDDVALVDGAVPVQPGWFELEDGVQVLFDAGASYAVGDYWLIPARTRMGGVLWPTAGAPPVPVPLPRLGVEHHYCTLALATITGGVWAEPRDCRRHFPPLTEIGDGCCCASVEPGEDIQQAIDTVVAAGGGCVELCAGVHRVAGPLHVRNARNLSIGGEGAASVLLFTGAEGRDGGLIVEGSERVDVHDLAVLSGAVPALVTLRPDANWTPNREVALRRLLLANVTPSDGETAFTCGIRLGHARGVTIDACRIAAEVGVLGLWGDVLPALPDLGGGDETVTHVTFDAVPPNDAFPTGQSFADPGSGVRVSVQPFFFDASSQAQTGAAVAVPDHRTGGSGQEMTLRTAGLGFELDEPVTQVTLRFANQGSRFNLRVNGELRVFSFFPELQGANVGGVAVSVAMAAGSETVRGELTLRGTIRSFVIGGLSLSVDDVRLVTVRPGEPGDLRAGDGVAELAMRDSRVRFRDFGVLAARAERWSIDGSDLQPSDGGVWAEARQALADEGEEDEDPATAVRVRRMELVLAALERVLAVPAALPRGAALAAFLWRDGSVRHSTLAGLRGIDVWWWIRGSVEDVEVTAGQAGLLAFWLHETGWHRNRVTCTQGAALAFGGAFRAHVAHNRVRGLAGLVSPPADSAAESAQRFIQTLARAYGEGDDATARFVVLWRMLETTVDLLGLRALTDALERAVGAALDGLPVTLFVGPMLLEWLASLGDGGVRGLPVIDLHVTHNDFACDEQCVALDGFLPLGALRVESNRVHTITGQAVRLETHALLANPHLVARLARVLLRLLARRVTEALDDVDDNTPAESAVLREVAALLARWQAGVERLVDLDLRVAGNTIRSLRTAIRSNLYELSVLDNHITLQERRPVGPARGGTGVVLGTVRLVTGQPVAGATVRVAGTTLGAITAANGSYRVGSVPAGTHNVVAAAPGIPSVTVPVTLRADEDETVDFELGGRLDLRDRATARIHRVSTVSASVSAAASNLELLRMAEALERSPALEPFSLTLRDGGHVDAVRYAGHLADGPLATAPARAAAADAVAVVGSLTSDSALASAAAGLATALRGTDPDATRAYLVAFLRGLQGQVDGLGILARGLGCRIVGNHVLVPEDADPDAQALGGIQLSVELFDAALLLLVAQVLLDALGARDDERVPDDPLLGVTETLVENNEVIGGVGHGISVLGTAGAPDFLPSLRVRGNQIRGLGGVGIFTNEHALLLDAEIAANHVDACGRDIGLSLTRGGIVMRTAALCTVRANHVTRCGAGQVRHDAFGVDLESIYGLQLSDNVLRANGSDEPSATDGGLSLIEVYGSCAVHDNVIAFNRGLGLLWTNSARTGEDALLPPFLLAALGLHLRAARTAAQVTQGSQCSLHGNVLESAGDSALPLFRLQNLNELAFTGNSCRAEARGTPLGEIQMVVRGSIANNLLQTTGDVSIAVKKLAEGVVIGNVGNRPIRVQPLGAGIRHDFNVPPVV